MRGNERLTYALRFAALFAAYVVTARVGLAMGAVGGVATTVWPPSGIALGALMLAGRGLWPAIALGAFAANLSVGVPIASAVGIATGNTLEALLGLSLMRRFGSDRDPILDSLRRTLGLIVCGAMVSTLVAATVGATSASLASMTRREGFALVWWNWWVGDALGILLVVPVMLGIAVAWRKRSRPERLLEAALTFLLLGLVSAVVFGWRIPGQVVPHAYAVIPPLCWIAVRLRQPATGFATFLVAVIAVIETARGAGPFIAATRAESLLWLQAFMSVVAITGLILAAVSAERERARSRVTEEHALVSAILDAAGLLVVLDRNGRIVRMNRACEALLGVLPDEVHGRLFWNVYAAPDERDALQSAFGAVVRDHVPAEWETHVAAGERGTRSVLWSSTPLPDATGALKYVITSGNDLTDRRQLEAQLVLKDRLAAVGTLAAGVGHEVNNPLAYLMLSLEMAAKIAARAGVDELENLIGVAREGAERVRKIVGDLRAFARTSDAGSGAANGPVDVHEVLDSSIRIAWSHIRHRAQLVKSFGGIPSAYAESGRLGQVFLNLLINAAQAIPEGHADRNMIRVSTETAAEDRIVVSISDTGVGIEPHALGRLFEPFFTTRPVGEGVGLGLSVCHTIVTGFGGSISVESEPGRGTLFRVVLPAAKPKHSPSEEPAPEGAPVRPLRVLVVDDEPGIAKTLSRALDEHEVTCAGSGREALELLQTREFDLILCDLLMPDLTGMDLYDRIWRLKPGYEDRIVFMTGGAFTARAQEFLSRVPNAKIQKPFDFAALKQLIAERAEHKALH